MFQHNFASTQCDWQHTLMHNTARPQRVNKSAVFVWWKWVLFALVVRLWTTIKYSHLAAKVCTVLVCALTRFQGQFKGRTHFILARRGSRILEWGGGGAWGVGDKLAVRSSQVCAPGGSEGMPPRNFWNFRCIFLQSGAYFIQKLYIKVYSVDERGGVRPPRPPPLDPRC